MLAFHHVSEIAAQHWMVSPPFRELNQQRKPLFEAIPVDLQLFFAPGFERVLRNIGQVFLRGYGITDMAQSLISVKKNWKYPIPLKKRLSIEIGARIVDQVVTHAKTKLKMAVHGLKTYGNRDNHQHISIR